MGSGSCFLLSGFLNDADPDPQHWVHTEKGIFLAKQTEPRHRLHRPLRQSHIQRYKLRVILLNRVSDPYSFFTDPDPDPEDPD
jgi:hypothetical protein